MHEQTTNELAYIRTSLSLHRTSLSYIRTFFSLLLGGLALIHYFDASHNLFKYCGAVFIVFAFINLYIGNKMRIKILKKLKLLQ